jgi:hypothetical protein
MVDERFGEVEDKIGMALKAVEGDGGASPVLTAVVRDFHKKAGKARQMLEGDAAAQRDAVIELEQAGDSAKAAVEADAGVADATRQAVEDAHLAICILKSKW